MLSPTKKSCCSLTFPKYMGPRVSPRIYYSCFVNFSTHATVSASDEDHNLASVDLDVFITDVNDNAPTIILHEKVINVVEGTKLG